MKARNSKVYNQIGLSTILLISTLSLSGSGSGSNSLKIISPPTAVCAGENFILKATGGTNYTYQWLPATSLNYPNIAEPTAKIYSNTLFTVIRTSLSTDDRDTAFVEIIVMRKNYALKGPEYICRGTLHKLQIPDHYTQPIWNNGSRAHSIEIDRGGFYSFKAYEGCYLIEGQLFIRDINKPISRIISSGQSDICEGQSLELNALSLENLQWSTGSKDPKIIVSAPGVITLQNSNECGISTDKFEVRTHSVTAAYLPEKWESQTPYNHIIYNHSEYADYFEWYLNDRKISMEKQPVLYLSEPGLYYLKLLAIDRFGCKDEVTYAPITVTEKKAALNPEDVIVIPNSFSPNGDGLNDELFIYGSGIKRIDVTIFDRWGGIVFEFKGPYEGWKGTDLQGQLMPQGLYTLKYSFVLEDGTAGSRSMPINLLR